MSGWCQWLIPGACLWNGEGEGWLLGRAGSCEVTFFVLNVAEAWYRFDWENRQDLGTSCGGWGRERSKEAPRCLVWVARGSHLPLPTAGLKHHRKAWQESYSDPAHLASAPGHDWKWEKGTNLLTGCIGKGVGLLTQCSSILQGPSYLAFTYLSKPSPHAHCSG